MTWKELRKSYMSPRSNWLSAILIIGKINALTNFIAEHCQYTGLEALSNIKIYLEKLRE